jgi:siroheme synthase-like protein
VTVTVPTVDPLVDEPRSLYPVSLVLSGKPVLVVGGGRVAARKVVSLLACEALVTVVAPSTVSDIDDLEAAGSITLQRRSYAGGEAAGYRLVLTATGVPAVDAQVARDAEAAGVWVNVADDADRGTFHVPAIHRDGPVLITVSTGGTSPALAAWLRSKLELAAGPRLGDLAAMLGAARRRLRSEGRDAASLDWGKLLDSAVPELVRDGRLDEAQRLVDEFLSGGAGDALPCRDGSD